MINTNNVETLCGYSADVCVYHDEVGYGFNAIAVALIIFISFVLFQNCVISANYSGNTIAAILISPFD